MNTAANNQIITLFEECGLTPELISEGLKEYDISTVKAVLYNNSAKYRESIKDGNAKELDFSDTDLSIANRIIKQVAEDASTPDGDIDYRARLKAAIYLREDKKGRRDARTGLRGLNLNPMVLQQFNLHLQQTEKQLASNGKTSTLTSANPGPVFGANQHEIKEAVEV